MAHKDTLQIGHLFVTSFCRNGTSTVAEAALNSNQTEHVVQIKNGSTLPYDVEVVTALPDSPPINPAGKETIEFAHGTNPRAATWTAYVDQLPSRAQRPDAATIHVVASAPGSVRLASREIYYRTGRGVAWEEDPTRPSTLWIELKIV